MSLEKPHGPSSPKNKLHIPTPLIGAVVALLAVLVLTYKGFQDSFLYLGILVMIPAGVFLMSRPAILLILALITTSAKIWLPLLPLDLPVDIFMRMGLVALVVSGGIIVKNNVRRLDPYRLAAYAFIGLILITMIFRGTGFYQLGGSLWGGKAYLVLLVNLAFLLLVPGTVTLTRRQWTWCLILVNLAPLSVVLAESSYVFSGGRFYYLYYFFRPSGEAATTAFEFGQQDAGLWRLQSLSQLKLSYIGMFLLPWLQRKPLGWIFFLGLVGVQIILTGLSGFRGALVLIPVYLFFFLFLYYPRHRIRLVATMALAGLLVLAAVYALEDRLPQPVQRALSWLPGLKVDPRITQAASGSTNWRLDMWHIVLNKDVPRFWLFGKGLAYNPSRLIDEIVPDYWIGLQNFITLMNYHNAPLILLVGFGIWGLILMLVLLIAAGIRCYQNLRHEWGDPVLHHYFLVVFSLYVVSAAGFLFLYGNLDGSLQNLLTLIVIMELLVRSDPKLSALAPVSAPRKLIDHPGRNTAGPRLIRQG